MYYESGEDSETLRFFCGPSSACSVAEDLGFEVVGSAFFFFTTTPLRPAFFFTVGGATTLGLLVDGPGAGACARTGGLSLNALRAAIALCRRLLRDIFHLFS